MKLEKLDPELFTWETYDYYYWNTLGCGPFDDDLGQKIKQHAIGYCDASRLTIRPKTDFFAVMCETDDHKKFWFHIDQLYLEKLAGHELED